MSIDTTTTPGAPIPAPPAHWRARRVPDAQHPETTPSAYPLTPAVDPVEAARVCAQIQNGPRPDSRVVHMWNAANCLAAGAAAGPDDEVAEWLRQVIYDLRDYADYPPERPYVPAPSRIRPEVPGTEAA